MMTPPQQLRKQILGAWYQFLQAFLAAVILLSPSRGIIFFLLARKKMYKRWNPGSAGPACFRRQDGFTSAPWRGAASALLPVVNYLQPIEVASSALGGAPAQGCHHPVRSQREKEGLPPPRWSARRRPEHMSKITLAASPCELDRG